MKDNLKGFVPLKNYENTYLINKDTQQIYSIIKRKILKGSIIDGYLRYSLKNANGIVKSKPYHRLLMETFVENPNDFPCINHIDGNKLNNSLDNLEWCSISYNNKEAYRLGLRKVSEKTMKQFMRDCHTPKIITQAIENLRKNKDKAIKHSVETNSKPIAIFKDDFYKEFKKEIDACNYLGVRKGSVGRVANKKTNTIKGYNAKYL